MRSTMIGLLLFSLCLGTSQETLAGAGRTRPGGGGSSSAGGAVPGGGKQRVPGTATYGYGYGHRHGYYGYPYYGYAGWPYFWGGWYARPVVVAGKLAPAPRVGAVELDVKPKKAAVTVDGKYVGQARDFNGKWDLLWLAPGGHSVELSRDGYRTLRLYVEVEAGEQLMLVEQLSKGSGMDARSEEIPVRAASRVEPPPESAAAATRFEPRPASALRRGLLRLSVRPTDAAVYLDGEFLASAGELSRLHGAIPVAQGTHSLEIVRPGFVSERREIEVGGEEPVRIEIDLLPED